MKRFDDWHQRLRAYIETTRNVPYQLPAHDCAHWVAGAIEAMTGIKLSDADYPYHTEAEAQQQMEKHGGLVAIFSALLGVEMRGPNNAHQGDVVYWHPSPDIESVGICVGDKFCLPGDTGLVFYPLHEAQGSWRI